MEMKISQKQIYLIYSGATAFFFSLIFTVSQVYRIDMLKLNPLQLVFVGTVLEGCCFIFEIPTGVVADIRSRKLSVITGLALMGIAFIVEGTVPLFSAVIFSQVLWGVGYTFTSGADEAWIADEVKDNELDLIYLRGAQIGQVFSIFGIVVSTVIGSMRINLPIIIGGILFIVLAVFLGAFMRETNFKPMSFEERNSWGQMWFTFNEGIKFIKAKTVMKLVAIMSLLYGLYSEGFDRLWTAHFLENIGFPNFFDASTIIWIGIIDGSAMLLSIIVVQYIKKKAEKTGELEKVWILTIINVLMVGAIVLFSISGNFVMGMSTYLCFYILRTTNGPIYRAWINKNIKSEVRATVLSTYGQIDALGQIIGGPMIGLIALKIYISAAIFVSAVILSPIIVLFIYWLRVKKAQDRQQADNVLAKT